MDRTPLTLALTAYPQKGRFRLLIQEHENNVAAALRPHYVITTDLWTEGPLESATNRDVVLAIAAALMEMVNPVTEDGHRLSRA